MTSTTARPPKPPSRAGRFQDFESQVQGWYVLCPSREVNTRKPASLPLFGSRFVVWRDASNAVRVADARCPHLGADLGHGFVSDGQLHCAVHRWSFGPEGRCRHAPGQAGGCAPRALRTYVATERWGLVWFFLGGAPLFPLPDVDPEGVFVPFVLRGPAKDCHPHVVTANGLDGVHFEQLHNFHFTDPPRLEDISAFSLRLHLRGHPRGALLRRLTGTHSVPMEGEFTTYGGNISVVSIRVPFRFHFLMAGRPSPAAPATETHTVAFFPRKSPASVVNAMSLVVHLFKDDTRILEHFHMTRAFTPADTAVRRFVDLVDAMPVW